MTTLTVDTTTRRTAAFAGLTYLVIIAAGIFAEFFVRSSLKVAGDAALTAGNIVAAEGLFRAGVAADIVMILADVVLGLLLYVLFRAVSRPLALLAAFLRLAQAAVLGMNLLNLFFALQLLSGAGYLAVLGAEQQQALALLFLEAHAFGYAVGLAFFGLHLVVLGYLVLKSGLLPRLLGVMLLIAAAAYLGDTFARIMLTDYASYEGLLTMVVLPAAFIAELAMALWLLLKGVRTPQLEREIAVDAAQAEGLAT